MKNPIKDDIFFYLSILTSFFLLLEISFFIQCNRAYLFTFTFMSDHLKLPLTMLPGIVFFIFAQLLVHFSYCFMILLFTLRIADLFSLSNNHKIILGLTFWTIGMIGILAANQLFFPNSKFAELSIIILSHETAKWMMILSVFILFLASCLFLWSSRVLKIIVLGWALVAGYGYYREQKIPTDAATKQRPNIIFIGVDSLRPDFLSFFGYENTTPFFDSFLTQATVFNEAVTPLARTFPSWIGILTGQYPRESGIRTNLAPPNQINLSNSLPFLLQKEGYETLYATDETRFSNIDHQYGFDHVISPPMGLNDFLLGTFNDFPLSNLLINTTIGKWLFPYSYANRPVYFTYEPNSFLKLIEPYLQKDRKKPMFLAIHFCLPHHPYLWSDLSGYTNEPLERYEKSISRVDLQLQNFFSLLKKANLLKHTIIVLLSDHGEALELSGDRVTEKDLFISETKKPLVPQFYPPGLDHESVNQSVGHGTDVLSLTQYHTLLAFKLYGLSPQRQDIISGTVSLLDIKPTILDLINIKIKNLNQNSNSLASIILGKTKVLKPAHHIFLESDFTPAAIRTVYPETRKVILEGIKIFQIDKTTKLTVKDDMGKMIIKSKQYADIYQDWILALYPQNNHYRMPILVNLKNGKWTNDLKSSFAKHSPAMEMLTALHKFYGNELQSNTKVPRLEG